MSNDDTRFIVCDTCKQSVRCEPTQTLDFPDNGWTIPINELGFYGGFTDIFYNPDDDENKNYLVMCHDCIVKLLELFPLFAQRLGYGCHPTHGDDPTPCCDFAWRINNGVAQRATNGKWIPFS